MSFMKFHSIKEGKALCGSKKGMGYFTLKDFKYAMRHGIVCSKCAKIVTDNLKK